MGRLALVCIVQLVSARNAAVALGDNSTSDALGWPCWMLELTSDWIKEAQAGKHSLDDPNLRPMTLAEICDSNTFLWDSVARGDGFGNFTARDACGKLCGGHGDRVREFLNREFRNETAGQCSAPSFFPYRAFASSGDGAARSAEHTAAFRSAVRGNGWQSRGYFYWDGASTVPAMVQGFPWTPSDTCERDGTMCEAEVFFRTRRERGAGYYLVDCGTAVANEFHKPDHLIARQTIVAIELLVAGVGAVCLTVTALVMKFVSPRQRFRTPLHGCFSDIGQCCLVCWCPCVQWARIADWALDDEGPWPLFCLLYWICGNFRCCMGMITRRLLREKLAIAGTCMEDCLIHTFAHYCALCQEARELRADAYGVPTVAQPRLAGPLIPIQTINPSATASPSSGTATAIATLVHPSRQLAKPGAVLLDTSPADQFGGDGALTTQLL